MATLSYFVGGVVADKFSARKLLTVSFLATGVLGWWFSTFPGFQISRIIFILMGISTIITYWSAAIKATRMLGDSSEQGRLFGWQEGLRGLLNALLVFGMTAVYSHFSNEILGTTWAIRVCAITVFIIGILNWFVIEDTAAETHTEPLSKIVIGMFKTLKMPRTWVLVAIVFFAYSIYGILGYINTYAINVYGLSVAGGTTLGGIRYLVQAAGGIIGGIIADKMGSRIRVIIGGAGLLTLCFAGFLILPDSAGLLTAIIANFIFGLFLIYVVRSQYFAIIDDAGFPVELTGRVSGIVSCLGYLPDVFMYTMIGGWLDANPGKAGFNMMFMYAIAMGIGCIIFSVILTTIIKKAKASGTIAAKVD